MLCKQIQLFEWQTRVFFVVAFVKQRKLRLKKVVWRQRSESQETIGWKAHSGCCDSASRDDCLWIDLEDSRLQVWPRFLKKKAVSGLSKSIWDLTSSVMLSGLITALYFRPPVTQLTSLKRCGARWLIEKKWLKFERLLKRQQEGGMFFLFMNGAIWELAYKNKLKTKNSSCWHLQKLDAVGIQKVVSTKYIKRHACQDNIETSENIS